MNVRQRKLQILREMKALKKNYSRLSLYENDIYIHKDVYTQKEYVKDERGNRAFVDYFGSVERARKALNTLKNCTNCTNCTHCSLCYGCEECHSCKDCNECKKCRSCAECAFCEGCKNVFAGDGNIYRPGNPHFYDGVSFDISDRTLDALSNI